MKEHPVRMGNWLRLTALIPVICTSVSAAADTTGAGEVQIVLVCSDGYVYGIGEKSAVY